MNAPTPPLANPQSEASGERTPPEVAHLNEDAQPTEAAPPPGAARAPRAVHPPAAARPLMDERPSESDAAAPAPSPVSPPPLWPLPPGWQRTGWRRVWTGLRDVVFPPQCVACGEVADGWQHLCRKCVVFIHRVQPPHCRSCGHPFFGVVADERICEHCAELFPVFDAACAAALFKGPLRALVIELKYHHGLHVLRDVETLVKLHPYFAAFVRGARLVPVPLHPRKERTRGYNQAELLAQAFATAAGGGTRVEPLLVRVLDTSTQTAFDRRTRQANLKNAFALRPGAQLNPDLSYLLVDDVFTTGSTLNACAAVLRAAGARHIRVATLAHG